MKENIKIRNRHTMYRLFAVIGVSLLGWSCENMLERDIFTSLSEERVIRSYDFTRNRVSAIYNVLPNGFSDIGGALQATVTDEMEHTLESSSVHRINNGAWNAYNNPDDRWNTYYRGIRKANQVLVTIDSINLDMFRLDPDATQQQVYKERLAEMNRWKYEVRFLRAFFYAELIKRYGGVPIVEGTFDLDSDAGSVSRNTLDECVQYVLDECDSAANVLPPTYGSGDLGRATQGAALALKSRMLLYAASDLFNDASWASAYADPQFIALPQVDRMLRWEEAATAAKAVIDLPGAGYALHTDYPGLFKTFNSPEIIFTRRSGASNTFEIASFPVGYDLGQSGNAPAQNLVDAYEVIVDNDTSEPFDWGNPAHAASPYANRDPRLAYSVLLNNTSFKGRPVEAWIGGRDGVGRDMATKTGYYLRKYVDENLNLLTGTTSIHSWIYIRLAEIYLNYAEALNEFNPGHPDIKHYVDLVRTRRGVEMPVLPDGLDQDEMRGRIRNERRVELAFEGHRLWDVKRWMIANETLGAPLMGVEIQRSSDGEFSYQVMQVETRVFQPRMYFYPIGQQELLKATGLVQNPMW